MRRDRLSGGRAQPLNRFDKRPRGKRLGQVGDATRRDCRGAYRLAVVAGNVDDRESHIFGRQTQTQIAEEVGISQMHVSRLLARSLAKLREAVSEDDATG